MTVPDLDRRPTVLIFADHYLPGFKAGGPIRTINNLIEALGDTFRLLVFTRDRDAATPEAYGTVRVDDWNKVGKAMVFYASPRTLSWRGIGKVLRETRHDLLYLNSFFSPRLTLVPILLRRVGRYRSGPVVIAPRGEFSPGALALKPTKKRVYIWLARALGLYRYLNWQASSSHESEQIRHVLGSDAASISVVPNLPSVQTQGQCTGEPQALSRREPGPLRVVFTSRIAPMKNLDFLLEVLANVKGDVEVTVCGPIFDAGYWAYCQALVDNLPRNVVFKYAGEVAPERVCTVFAQHDVFVFPTRGENFGHVIFEALTAGTAAVLSDQTPWPPDPGGAVEVLSLGTPQDWVATIERWADFDDRAFTDRRAAAADYVKRYLASNDGTGLTRRLFLSAMERSARAD